MDVSIKTGFKNITPSFLKKERSDKNVYFKPNTPPAKEKQIILYYPPSYYNAAIKQKVNFPLIKSTGIKNVNPTDNGVRGETLSGDKNRRFIKILKEAGIKNVIDLRGGDASSSYADLCSKNRLGYYRCPIDSKLSSTREVIDNLPELFSVLNEGNYYIACAQGLHRTDIALALNYFFNPKAPSEPPKMVGHISEKGFAPSSILERTNSVFKSLTPKDKENLGLSKDFGKEEYDIKKKKFIEANKKYASELNYS